jgi:hypothetical protein
MIDIALLGLVSQQIHRHGGQNVFDWPGQEYGHAMGLLLFVSIFGLLVTIFHWAFSSGIYAILFIVSQLSIIKTSSPSPPTSKYQDFFLISLYFPRQNITLTLFSDPGCFQRYRSWYPFEITFRRVLSM